MTGYSNKKWYKPTKFSTKIIYTIILLFLIRMCSNIPVPLINKEYLKYLFEGKDSAYALINAFSGGSFTRMTFMAIGVTPYITASIILSLLTITFPKLKDIQQDGESGKKKWQRIQIFVGIALGLLQSVGIAITFGRQGLIDPYKAWSVAVVSLIWTIGATITILIGEYITKFCIGNGVSLLLASNIISELPSDILNFFNVYIKDNDIAHIIISIITFSIIVIGLIVATIILNNAQKEINVIYAGKSNENKYNNLKSTKNQSMIPIKLNIAGVMPVIFTSTLYSLPLMFLSNSSNRVAQEIVAICSSSSWFDLEHWWRISGFILYFVLVIGFAYFYGMIQFNTVEIAHNLKSSGAMIPGIRPGKPTVDYLNEQSKWLTLYGAIFLFVLTQIPTLICCFSNIKSLSFGGTSILIIVGVILETTITIKSELMLKSYKKHSSILGL